MEDGVSGRAGQIEGLLKQPGSSDNFGSLEGKLLVGCQWRSVTMLYTLDILERCMLDMLDAG